MAIVDLDTLSANQQLIQREEADATPPQQNCVSMCIMISDQAVPVGSLRLRRMLRSVVVQHQKRVNLPDSDDRFRRSVLTQALLYVLETPRKGMRIAMRTWLDLIQAAGSTSEQSRYWEEITARLSKWPGSNPRDAARGSRLSTIKASCDEQLLIDCIEYLEQLVRDESSNSNLTKSSDPSAKPSIDIETKSAAGSRVHLVRTPVPWSDSDPLIQLARPGSRAFFGMDSIAPQDLVNVMILGGTGSGKTVSTVLPMLEGLLRYRLHDGKRAALLVIDPKRELVSHVQRILSEQNESDRLTVIGECPPIGFFAADSALSASEKLDKLSAFSPEADSDSRNAYWRNLGMAMLRDLLQLDAVYLQAKQQARLFEHVAKQLQMPIAANLGLWGTLREVLGHARSSSKALRETDRVLRALCKRAGIQSAAARVLEAYTADGDLISQFNYVCMSAMDTLGNQLSDPDLAGLIDFDVQPSANTIRLDIAQEMEQGRVVIFTPETRLSHRLAAKALKAKWYEAVFSRTDLERPVGTVIDEAQKFLTCDPETGEQAFLDRCRAYRAITVLATQSLASLKYEFGSGAAATTALGIISANTPTKFIFRSTDPESVDWLRIMIPPPVAPGPHVIDVRRPSMLQRGEAYYLLANGTWDRGQVHLNGLSQSEAVTATHGDINAKV